jgi:threonyl-tRNA synthetase
LAKIPYMLVVGDREAADGTVSVRRLDGQKTPAQPIDAVAAQIRNEILNREPGPAPSAAATDKGRA